MEWLRQNWVTEHNGFPGTVSMEAQARPKNMKDASRGPSLGTASHLVGDGSLSSPASEAAIEFGHSQVGTQKQYFSEGRRQPLGLMRESISSKPFQDQRIVMGPDRTVVVAHGVIGLLGVSQGAESQTAEYRWIHQMIPNALGLLGVEDTGPETMAHIRTLDPARLEVTVQGEGGETLRLEPEQLIEMGAKAKRLDLVLMRAFGLSEERGQFGGPHPGFPGISLDLGK
jgi:hypothetical protein